MKQKVWYIDDPYWEEKPETGEEHKPCAVEPETETQAPAVALPKSPARSFSLSMVIWGSGQMYNGAYLPGSLFMAAMPAFYAPLAVMLFRSLASRPQAGSGIPAMVFVAGVMGYLFIGLFCWLANAVDAYYRTVRSRSEPFRGVDNELHPLLGSILFPGCGQFLNGQPVKGLFFLICGLAGVLAVAFVCLILYIWPGLKAGPAGDTFEICLVVALLLIPIAFVTWLVSAYDAYRSCKELSHEKKRSSSSVETARKTKPGKYLLPRLNAVLVMLLAISVGMQSFPRTYYLDSLEKLRIETLNHHLEIIPGLLGKVIGLIDH
jgi:TM2 domain-containing membrane protein YozV